MNEITQTSTSQKQSSPMSFEIKPLKGWVMPNWRELWQYRELLYFLTWREIKVRYKQTVLGVGWAILQPFVTMIIFSLIFGGLAQIPSDDVPYPIFSYTALVPWTFFAVSLTNATASLVSNGNMLKKIYFPRLTLPVATILSNLVDFVLAFSILLLMMLFFQISPTVNIIYVPLFLFQAIITALGVGMWLSVLNVQFRDVRYIAPFLVQIWLWITPVAYPASLIENEVLRFIYNLNPMAGVIEGFRWALLGTATQPDVTILIGTAVSIILFISGFLYFNRMEKIFADVI